MTRDSHARSRSEKTVSLRGGPRIAEVAEPRILSASPPRALPALRFSSFSSFSGRKAFLVRTSCPSSGLSSRRFASSVFLSSASLSSVFLVSSAGFLSPFGELVLPLLLDLARLLRVGAFLFRAALLVSFRSLIASAYLLYPRGCSKPRIRNASISNARSLVALAWRHLSPGRLSVRASANCPCL